MTLYTYTHSSIHTINTNKENTNTYIQICVLKYKGNTSTYLHNETVTYIHYYIRIGMYTTGIQIRIYVRIYGRWNAKEGEAREERNKRSAEDERKRERERQKRGESMGGGHRGDGVSDLPKVARRSTRASAVRPQRDATAAAAAAAAAAEEEEVVEEAEGETEAGGGVGAGGMDMVVRWPEGGVVTVDWVMGLGNVLDYASRNLQPSQLPDVIPVSVADSLILAASKVCILAYWVGGGVFF